ncbi:hypothetical protein EON79_04965 [bacterium]|nr:MAG: hypothetical protein EON79_04965 [bacterium]
MLAILALVAIVPSAAAVEGLSGEGAAALAATTRYFLPPEPTVPHRGIVPGADAEALLWTRRTLKPEFQIPKEGGMIGTVFPDLDALEYRGKTRGFGWRYLDDGYSGALLLEAGGDTPVLRDLQDVTSQIAGIVDLAIASPVAPTNPPTCTGTSKELSNGRRLWYGTFEADVPKTNGAPRYRPGFWIHFNYWTDGKQTLLRIHHTAPEGTRAPGGASGNPTKPPKKVRLIVSD